MDIASMLADITLLIDTHSVDSRLAASQWKTMLLCKPGISLDSFAACMLSSSEYTLYLRSDKEPVLRINPDTAQTLTQTIQIGNLLNCVRW